MDPPRLRSFKTVPPVRFWPCIPGTGCVLIHRTVLEAVGKKHADSAFPWFEFSRWDRVDDQGAPVIDVMGEDYTFMIRANALGFSSWVDTTIEVDHIKSSRLTPSAFWPHIVPDETFVVIPVKDNLSMTRDLLFQLREQGGVKGIFVFDNGSGPETKKWLRKQRIAEVFDAKGMGIHHMWNAGALEALKRTRRANVAFLNNDLELGPAMLTTLADALRSNELMAVCPNYDGRYPKIPADVDVWGLVDDGQEPREEIEQLHGICANRYDGSGGLAGFCFMVRGELFEMGYRFPEDAMWWYGDNDLTLTLDQNSAPYAMVHAATVKHLDGGGQTGGWQDPEMQAQLERDRLAFMAKWSPEKVA